MQDSASRIFLSQALTVYNGHFALSKIWNIPADGRLFWCWRQGEFFALVGFAALGTTELRYGSEIKYIRYNRLRHKGFKLIEVESSTSKQYYSCDDSGLSDHNTP